MARWRNVSTGAVVDCPDFVEMPAGVYEIVKEAAKPQESCPEKAEEVAPEPDAVDEAAEDELSSADW